MNEPQITPELVASHGLKPDEYERILKLIGGCRVSPNSGFFRDVERALLVQSSRIHLRGLPTKAPWVIQGRRERRRHRHRRRPAVVFKMESHNHRAISSSIKARPPGRRHFARRVHDGCAPDCVPQCALLWRAGASQDAPSRLWRRCRRRRVRQSFRVPTVRQVRFTLAMTATSGQCDGRRPRGYRQDILRGCFGREHADRLSRLQDRP
jgi:hypothetical protein